MEKGTPVLVQWRRGEETYHTPVAIVLTDAEEWEQGDAAAALRDVMEQEEALPEGDRLMVHVIGFGRDVNADFIEELAELENRSHVTCRAAKDMDRLRLVHAFARIAAQPQVQIGLA